MAAEREGEGEGGACAVQGRGLGADDCLTGFWNRLDGAAAGLKVAWISTTAGHRSGFSSAVGLLGGTGLVLPPPLAGVFCVMVAAGPGGKAWLGQVSASRWFEGLRPGVNDLGATDRAHGSFTVQPGTVDVVAVGRRVGACALPDASVASIAVLDGVREGDWFLVLGLAQALVEVRGRSGRPLSVVVTVGASLACNFEMVDRIRATGAVVVRGAPTSSADHLHQFPARALTIPEGGQLVGVDLRDYLAWWRPGSVADLFVIPLEVEAARAALAGIVPPGRVGAVILNAHVDLGSPDTSLADVDRLASICRQRFHGEREGGLLFTTRDRLDGVTCTADLLLVYEGTGRGVGAVASGDQACGRAGKGRVV